MNEKFEEILDKCIDSINKGESIDECLASHPEHAGELQVSQLVQGGVNEHDAVSPFV